MRPQTQQQQRQPPRSGSEMSAAGTALPARSRRCRRQRCQQGLLALLVAAAASCLCLPQTAHAQNLTTYTVRLAGAGGDDLARDVGLDGGGSAFVVGSFQSPVFSVGQQTNLSNARPEPALDGSRSSDAFVAKLTRFGQLAWAMSMGGWGDDAAAAVAVEPGSNAPAYVVGSFDSAELVLRAPGGAPAQALIKAPDEKTWTGLSNALVAKVDTKGAIAWALQLGGADGDEAATAVAVDAAQGRVYVVGTFASAALPVGGAATLHHAGGAVDGFIVALSTADGSVQWAVGLQGAGADSPMGLAVDAATGSVYVTGVSDSAALALGGDGAEPLALGDEGAPTVFVARLQGASGAIEWARAVGGLTTAVVDPEVAVAAGGETVLVLLGQQPPLPAVVALEGRRGEPRWHAAAAGTQRLAVDAAGANAYLAGVFEEPLTLGGVTMAATAERGGDLYLARVDARTGRLEAGSSFGGGDSAVKVLAGLALDATGSVYMAGSYADGGLGFSTTLQPAALAGGTDSFLARVAMGATTQPRAPTRRPTNAPTTASAAAMATWSTLSEDSKVTTTATTTTTAEPTTAAAAANDADDATGSSTESRGNENLIALFSYAGTMEAVPYLQDAVFLLLHDFSSFIAYLTPGIRNNAGTQGRKLRRHRALTNAVVTSTTTPTTTPCADPKTPRIDVRFFVDPADTRAAGDIQNLLDGVRGGEIPLRYWSMEFSPAVLCDVQYGPTTLDASFFIPPPPAPADDDRQGGEGDIATIDGAMTEGGEAATAAKEVMNGAHSFFGIRVYLFVAIGAGGGGAILLWLLGWWLWKRWRGEYFTSPKRARMSNTVLTGAAATARIGSAPPTPGSSDGVSVLTEEGTAHTGAHRRAGSYGPMHSHAAPPLQMPATAIDTSQQQQQQQQQPMVAADHEAASVATEQGLQSIAGGGSSRLLVARPARASSRSTPPPVFIPSLTGGGRSPEKGAGEQQQEQHQELSTPCPVREDALAAPPAPPRSPLLTAVASLFSKAPSPLRVPAAGAQAQKPSPTKSAAVATAGPSPGTVKRREEEAERVRQAEAERERQRAEQEAMERQMLEAAALRRKQEEAAAAEAARVKAEKEAAEAAKEKARKEREAAEAMKKRQQQEAAEAAARLKAEKEAEEKARKEREALRRKQEEEARIKALKEAEEARLKKEREMAEALRKKKEVEEAARVQAQKDAEERQLQYQREREEKEKRLQELLRQEQEERRQRREKEKQQLAALAKQLQRPPSHHPPAGKAQQPESKHAPSPGGLDDLIGPVAAWDLGATGADHDAAASEAEAARMRAFIRPEVLAEMQAYAALPSASFHAARVQSPPPREGPPRPAPLLLECHASPSPPPAPQQAQPGSRGFLPSYLMPTSSSSTKQRGPSSK